MITQPCKRPRLGAHVSVAGGPSRACERASELGLDTMQIFVKNANRWQQRPLTAEEVESFRERRTHRGIDPVLAHASYLINVASPDRALRKRSERALVDELERCAALGIDALVLHPGARHSTEPDRAIAAAAKVIERSLERVPGVRLLLENTAGQGSLLGGSLGDLAALLSGCQLPSDRLGICIDTCHAYAAGYPIHRRAGWHDFLDRVKADIGIDRLGAVHMNDSLGELASRRDRHANLGRGKIGTRALCHLIRDPSLVNLPVILETPQGERLEGYRADLRILRRALARRR